MFHLEKNTSMLYSRDDSNFVIIRGLVRGSLESTTAFISKVHTSSFVKIDMFGYMLNQNIFNNDKCQIGWIFNFCPCKNRYTCICMYVKSKHFLTMMLSYSLNIFNLCLLFNSGVSKLHIFTESGYCSGWRPWMVSFLLKFLQWWEVFSLLNILILID